jgi:hypothetical protein
VLDRRADAEGCEAPTHALVAYERAYEAVLLLPGHVPHLGSVVMVAVAGNAHLRFSVYTLPLPAPMRVPWLPMQDACKQTGLCFLLRQSQGAKHDESRACGSSATHIDVAIFRRGGQKGGLQRIPGDATHALRFESA